MAEQRNSGGSGRKAGIGRRTFLAGAAAATVTIVKPGQVRGTQANSTLEWGLIGCGGRGNWIVPLFEKHGGYKLVACADYYQEHADRTGDKHGIPSDRRYTGLSGYKKLIDGKLDVVVIESPPYFHPEQAAAAVEAGKHVYCAKPIAVDVPGCKSIAESGRRATEKKLVFLIDFQTRANEHFREAAKRVHEGKIGRLVCGEGHYPCGVMPKGPPPTPADVLRHWYCIKALSGDFIVEQSIHSLDVATWFINADPVRAYGRGSSKGLRSYGDIYDHFNLIYEFPNDLVLSFYCVQMVHGAPNEIACRIFGDEGTVDSDYYSHVWMHTKDPKRNMDAEVKGLYTNGTIVNVREFHDAVMKGDCSNPTVVPSVRSNLTAILGREAAYTRRPITWSELMKSDQRLEADLSGLKA